MHFTGPGTLRKNVNLLWILYAIFFDCGCPRELRLTQKTSVRVVLVGNSFLEMIFS
jgi:hypothetical protein